MGLLTTKPDIPRQYLYEFFIVVFGLRGIGKTEFALNFPGAYLLRFEDGTKAQLSYGLALQEIARKKDLSPWDILKQVQDEFLMGDHNYKTIVWDTEDIAYDNCMDFVCRENNFSHPSDKGYGKGWKELNAEYQLEHRRIMMSKYGLISVSHARFKKIKDIYGNERDMLIPSVGGNSGQWLLDEADIIILYDKDEEGNRILRLESDKNFEAKQRLKFPEPIIPAGNSGKEAFDNFKKAFDIAIKENNKKFGITPNMIEEYYSEINQEKTLEELIDKIILVAKSKNMNGIQNSEEMKKIIGCESLKELDEEKANQYLEYLKNKE
jgi:hypothetical protein